MINVRRVLAGAGEVVHYAVMFLWAIFCPKAVLAARLLAAESQPAACKHEIASKKRPRPRFTFGFRLLWGVLSKCLDQWADLAHLMQPATVKKWHTRAFQHFLCLSSANSTTVGVSLSFCLTGTYVLRVLSWQLAPIRAHDAFRIASYRSRKPWKSVTVQSNGLIIRWSISGH